MKRAIRANTLISTLVLLGSLISLLFLGKEAWLDREQITRHSYQRYLNEKFTLLDYVAIDETLACNQTAQKTVYYPPANPQYAFHCVFHSLFLKTKPKEKFIVVEDVGQWLDLAHYQEQIYSIRTLSELPPSSEKDPKIVRTLNAINERLLTDFYGIVITDHPFQFTDRRIYGTIYSSYPHNDPDRRNHRFQRQVIENLERKYSRWIYLPSSHHTVAQNGSN